LAAFGLLLWIILSTTAAFCLTGIFKNNWRNNWYVLAGRILCSLSAVFALALAASSIPAPRVNTATARILVWALLFILPMAIIIYRITGVPKSGSRTGYWIAARVIFSLAAGVACLYGLFLGVFWLTAHTFDRDRRRLFAVNFAMPLDSIGDLKGEESSWMGYGAWISFTYHGDMTLKHPEEYEDVSCSTSIIGTRNPFTAKLNHAP
jgi:hypothetical protein